MKPKVCGCCSRCDREVFEVVRRDPETRLPITLGKPLEDAVRATFVLFTGSRMDLTFCSECAKTLSPVDFPHIWRRVMHSWLAESPNHPFPKSQTDNGIAGLLLLKSWKEVA